MPQLSKSSSHLYLKGNIFYFRQSVPADLRPYVGQSEVRVSLRTGFKAQARPHANRLSSGLSTIIKLLRGIIDMGFQDDVKAKWDDYIKWELRETEERGFDGSPVYKSPNEIDAFLKFFQDLLARKDYDKLIELMEEMAKSEGEPTLPTDMRKKRVFAHEFARSHVKLYTILKHRAEGDYDYEKTVGDLPVAHSPAQANPSSDLKLSEALDRYIKCQVKDGQWNADSEQKVPSTLRNFLFVVGDVPLKSIDRKTMRYFKDTFSKMPSRRALDARFMDLTVDEILEIAPKNTVGTTTITNNLRNANTFLSWCLNEGMIAVQPGLGLTVKKDKHDSEHRSPYTQQDLFNIFHSKQYVNDKFRVAFTFWCPLLALFTGARREEISQLYVSDIFQVDGLWVMSINHDANPDGVQDKQIKNPNARRLVPVHDFLVNDLCFPDFVKQMGAEGHDRVFHQLTKTPKKPKYGHKVGKHYSTFKGKIELEPSVGQKDFHSFRHTFSQFYKKKKMQDDVFKQVFGHEIKDMASKRYGEPFSVRQCYDDIISKLDYDVDLSHLAKSKWVVKGK